jgi:hypothetical protein
MNLGQVVQEFFVGLAVALLTIVVVALGMSTFGCSTVRDAQRLDEMSAAQVDVFAQRTAYQVAVFAEAALVEEDISPEAVAAVADAFRGLAAGSSAGAAGGLAEILKVDGYGAAALGLVVLELDAELERRGALEPGGAFSPAARVVFTTIADELDKLVTGD